MMDDEGLTLEETQTFFRFLQGELPPGIGVKTPPRLSASQAFTIVWFLQEYLRVIPDNYEYCNGCCKLFDEFAQGHYYEKEGKNYCSDECTPARLLEWRDHEKSTRQS